MVGFKMDLSGAPWPSLIPLFDLPTGRARAATEELFSEYSNKSILLSAPILLQGELGAAFHQLQATEDKGDEDILYFCDRPRRDRAFAATRDENAALGRGKMEVGAKAGYRLVLRARL